MTAPTKNWSTVLTPPGTGAIGVIRLVGPDTPSIIAATVRSNRNGKALSSLEPHRLYYGTLLDGEETVDDVLVSTADSGAQPAVDICAHGGVRVMERILQTLDRLGAPLRESTDQAASLWPTSNLIDHDVWDAISRAMTERCIRFLSWQRTHLPTFLCETSAQIRAGEASAKRRLEDLLDRYPIARRLLEGAKVALVGPPNSGKSSLLNNIVGRTAALVSSQAGTTRDWVSADIELDGLPVTLLDTAGCHPAEAGLEQTAINVGQRKAQLADLRLFVLDGSQPLPEDREVCLPSDECEARNLVVINKSDAGNAWDDDQLPSRIAGNSGPALRLSARTGEGMPHLLRKITEGLGFGAWADNQPTIFAPRQEVLTKNALKILANDPQTAAKIIAEQLIAQKGG